MLICHWVLIMYAALFLESWMDQSSTQWRSGVSGADGRYGESPQHGCSTAQASVVELVVGLTGPTEKVWAGRLPVEKNAVRRVENPKATKVFREEASQVRMRQCSPQSQLQVWLAVSSP